MEVASSVRKHSTLPPSHVPRHHNFPGLLHKTLANPDGKQPSSPGTSRARQVMWQVRHRSGWTALTITQNRCHWRVPLPCFACCTLYCAGNLGRRVPGPGGFHWELFTSGFKLFFIVKSQISNVNHRCSIQHKHEHTSPSYPHTLTHALTFKQEQARA